MIVAPPPQVVVIGAGVAGLAAARRLAAAGVRVVVLERAGTVGGRVSTSDLAGIPVDTGAQFFADFYDHTRRLLSELGLTDDILPIRGRAGIPRAGRMYSLWTNTLPVTPLISAASKLRLGRALLPLAANFARLNLYAPERAAGLDTGSIAEYAHAAFTEEVLEYAFYPVLSGVFHWTPERTSQAMLFVLLRAGLRLAPMRIFTLRGGMGRLPAAMSAGLSVTLDAEAEEVAVAPDGRLSVRFRVTGQPQLLHVDGVVIATTADVPARILPALDAQQRAFFTDVQYADTVVAAVEVRRRLPSNLYGILMPRAESPLLATINIESARHASGLPANRDVLLLHSTGVAALLGDGEAICAALIAELRRVAPLYDPGADVGATHITRWERALPEFNVGHFRRLAEFAAGAVERGARIVFAGDYLMGPFVETAIASGEAAAARLLDRLR
jgi:oxygen-dependent protoporphyrinogen oxidase